MEWENINGEIDRAKVPGGWLVRAWQDFQRFYPETPNAMPGPDWRVCGITFVPDPMHAWEVTRVSDVDDPTICVACAQESGDLPGPAGKHTCRVDLDRLEALAPSIQHGVAAGEEQDEWNDLIAERGPALIAELREARAIGGSFEVRANIRAAADEEWERAVEAERDELRTRMDSCIDIQIKLAEESVAREAQLAEMRERVEHMRDKEPLEGAWAWMLMAFDEFGIPKKNTPNEDVTP